MARRLGCAILLIQPGFQLMFSHIEVLHAPPLFVVPNIILDAPAHNPTELDVRPAYATLPPSPAHPPRVPDQQFLVSEMFTNLPSTRAGVWKLSHLVVRTVEYPVDLRRSFLETYPHTLRLDSSQDHAELGAILSGFSLSEQGHLAAAIEKTSQAVNTTHISTTKPV